MFFFFLQNCYYFINKLRSMLQLNRLCHFVFWIIYLIRRLSSDIKKYKNSKLISIQNQKQKEYGCLNKPKCFILLFEIMLLEFD